MFCPLSFAFSRKWCCFPHILKRIAQSLFQEYDLKQGNLFIYISLCPASHEGDKNVLLQLLHQFLHGHMTVCCFAVKVVMTGFYWPSCLSPFVSRKELLSLLSCRGFRCGSFFISLVSMCSSGDLGTYCEFGVWDWVACYVIKSLTYK